ncbi:MAG: family transporter [Pseudonocardiales bacterium]|nr:family transporter [Pseudonocardiales bacterium]
MEQAMERLVHQLLSHRRAVIMGWLLLCVVGGVFAAGLPGRIVSGGEAPESSQSEVVARALAHSPVPSLFIAVEVSNEATPADLVAATRSVSAAAARVSGVTGVAVLPDTDPVESVGARVAVLSLSTSGGTDGAVKAAHALSKARATLTPPDAQVHIGGFGAYRDELTVLSREDLSRAERVGIPIVFIVLFITFGSIWAASLPLAIALSSLLMGLGAVGAASFFLPMSDFVTNAASMIGIALGVDYAMFLVQRVRELTHTGASVDDALRIAMRSTGAAVLWSGLTVLLAESTLLIVDSRSIRSAAFGMVMVTLCAVLTALVVAPVLISLLGKRIAPARRHAVTNRASNGWTRWAGHVTRHAPAWLIASAFLMIALALPASKLHSSVNISGTSTLPASSSVRQAYELAAQHYGPAALSPIMVLIPPGHSAAIQPATAAIGRATSVAAVVPQSLPDGSAVLLVTSKATPYAASTRALVADLRSGSLHSELAGLHYKVGGETAASMDATKAMFDGLPRVGIVLLIVIGLLLLFALRSVFLPIKAVVLVVLSLGASLGSLLLLTTTSLGARLIGADGPGDIHPIVPVTIVAITVALSTDYEVILISRIGEHYRRTHDNRASIVEGVGRTGGVITSAAFIMIAVFIGFALADLPPLKQLGVGLALAVFIDATVVRGVLVPAAMAVMGDANWWWPNRWSAHRRRTTELAGPVGSVAVGSVPVGSALTGSVPVPAGEALVLQP